MSKERKIVRRQFIKDVAIGGAGVVVGSTPGAIATDAKDTLKKWDREADVVIVGSAVAGMCAAIEAAAAGAKVIVIEKESQPGGLSKLSGGAFLVAGTDVQARQKIEDKPDWLYDDMMESSEMTAVPELVRTFVDRGPENIRWLENLGVKFDENLVHDPNQKVARVHNIGRSTDYPGGRPLSGGLGLMLMLFKGAARHGVSPLLEHKMTRLIRPDVGGPVLGVEVIHAGKTLNFKANRGVILATGGYVANAQMCMAEDPRLTPDIFASGLPYVHCLGEGHWAAVNVGAGLSTMAYGGFLPTKWGTNVYAVWEPPNFNTVPNPRVGVTIADFQRVILVKSDGQRYVDEMLGDSEVAPPAYPRVSMKPSDFPHHPFNEAYLNLKERPRNVWAVTDADGAKALHWQIEQIEKPDPKSGAALYPDMVATAANLKDLAIQMSVDPAGLDATITKYNGFVEAGKDDDFGKPKPAHKIVNGPFYAAKMRMMNHTRRNGIRVNSRSQVLDRLDLLTSKGVSVDQENVIPHLYAAGECANYLGHYHLHHTLAVYSFYGRVAGTNAASEKAVKI